ncbi:MAG: RNA polymerase sigma factor [Streptococcaceae bacterium]|nr:RNA polymerase sigma factor [Streptococcaceae bacterium]
MNDFEEIYNLYLPKVYRYSLSLSRNEKIAEDVTQETFLKAFNSIHKFKQDCTLESWLCLIAKNTYFSMHKKDKRLQELDTDYQDEVKSIETLLINKENALEIHRILHEMEDPYKEVFYLRMFGELSFAEIGELFKKNENWARITYHRAKLKIKNILVKGK